MLNSRPMINGNRIRVLLDTEYLNVLLDGKDIKPKVFVDYQSSEDLEIIRTPGEAQSDKLRNIPEYIEKYAGYIFKTTFEEM